MKCRYVRQSGMNPLSTFLDAQPVRKPISQWAEAIGCSRSHLSAVISGRSLPGRDLISRIEEATGGGVPAAAWFYGTRLDKKDAAAEISLTARSTEILRDLRDAPDGAAIPARSFSVLRAAGLVTANHAEKAPPGRVIARLTDEGMLHADAAAQAKGIAAARCTTPHHKERTVNV